MSGCFRFSESSREHLDVYHSDGDNTDKWGKQLTIYSNPAEGIGQVISQYAASV